VYIAIIGWQNSTAKTDVVQASFKDGKWTAASKGDALLYNWQEEPRETTKEMDREHKKYNLRKQWLLCSTKPKWRHLVPARHHFLMMKEKRKKSNYCWHYCANGNRFSSCPKEATVHWHTCNVC